MNSIAYISQNKIFLLKDGKSTEIPCGRMEQYKQTLADIRRRNEWKTTGTGAKFMGTYTGGIDELDPVINAEICGIAAYKDGIVYSLRLDESGCIYIRSLDKTDMNENLIVSGKDIFPGKMSCFGNKLVVSCGENYAEKHISVYELPSSFCREYTDGDSIEEAPCFDGENKIYFSAAGYARDTAGNIAAVQNKSIVCLDTDASQMDEVISDEKYDFLCPKPDGNGGLYCIRQPAGGVKDGGDNILKDIVMFPVRIVKAFAGMLNYFSMIFGGESLRSGGNAKAKQKDEKQTFIDGNLINAAKNMKDAESKGEKYPGIMPQERILMHIGANGKQETVKNGVLDYTLMSDGGFAVSNGSHIIIVDKDGETTAFKADKAVSLTKIKPQ